MVDEYLERFDDDLRRRQLEYAKMQGFKEGEYGRRQYVFSAPYLHKQAFDFKTGVELHRNSASCVMPVALLCEAISMARHDPLVVDDESIDLEKHPSVKMICDWWNNAMPGCAHKAAFFFLNVRVQDNDVYFDINSPARDADGFLEDKQSQARVRDYILIDFFASASLVGENDDVLLVDGSANCLDMQPDRNPAYYCCSSLRDFPESFPALFEYFEEQSTY